MTTYRVFITNEVSTVVEVEADSPDEALAAWYDAPGAPGRITQGAFGDNSVDDTEWEARFVTDKSGTQVWGPEA